MQQNIGGIPVVVGRYGRRSVEVVCPFCHRKHFHGALTPDVPEHRVNDCDKTTKGYYVMLVDD